jgi:GNAT superfamily N-acetyltransferase
MPTYISITYQESVDGRSIPIRGNVSADLFNDHWNIARAVVLPQEARNCGIGTKMLKAFFLEVKKSVIKKVIVYPGGYEGQTEKQFNFYLKNGFKVGENSHELVWEDQYQMPTQG